jgi:hypothetical protein
LSATGAGVVHAAVANVSAATDVERNRKFMKSLFTIGRVLSSYSLWLSTQVCHYGCAGRHDNQNL